MHSHGPHRSRRIALDDRTAPGRGMFSVSAAARQLTTRRSFYAASMIRRDFTACAALLLAFGTAGCATQQVQTCSEITFEALVNVTIETELDIDDVGICDEFSCSTDAEVDPESHVYGVGATQSGALTWEFAVMPWTPESAGFVAIMDGEEIDLGEHEIEWSLHYPEGPDCQGIPVTEPLIIEL